MVNERHKYEVRAVLNRRVSDEHFKDLNSLEGWLRNVSVGRRLDGKGIVILANARNDHEGAKMILAVGSHLGRMGYEVISKPYCR